MFIAIKFQLFEMHWNLHVIIDSPFYSFLSFVTRESNKSICFYKHYLHWNHLLDMIVTVKFLRSVSVETAKHWYIPASDAFRLRNWSVELTVAPVPFDLVWSVFSPLTLHWMVLLTAAQLNVKSSPFCFTSSTSSTTKTSEKWPTWSIVT